VNYFKLDHRIMPPHPGEQLRHHDRAQGRGDGESDLPAGMGLVSADLIAGPLDVAQDALGAFKQLLTAFGQPYPPVCAGKQRDVELVLEALDMPGQSRLGDVKMGRGTGDAAELGDADEVVQATQFHLSAISLAQTPAVNRNYSTGCHAAVA
jgi:hypothetical protein